MNARFRVEGRNYDGVRQATVIIDRDEHGFFTVRPMRRHRTYTMLLADVAELVLWRCIREEAREKKREKLAKRRGAA